MEKVYIQQVLSNLQMDEEDFFLKYFDEESAYCALKEDNSTIVKDLGLERLDDIMDNNVFSNQAFLVKAPQELVQDTGIQALVLVVERDVYCCDMEYDILVFNEYQQAKEYFDNLEQGYISLAQGEQILEELDVNYRIDELGYVTIYDFALIAEFVDTFGLEGYENFRITQLGDNEFVEKLKKLLIVLDLLYSTIHE